MIIKSIAAFALLLLPVSIAAQSPAVDAARAAMADYDGETARSTLTLACDAADTAACRVLLGYLSGRYSDEEQEEAYTLGQTLCANDDLLGCVTFARLVENMAHSGADQSLALDSLEKACRGDFYSACPSAAEMADRGEIATQDKTLALELADLGCKASHARSCQLSGDLLRQAGWDTEDDAVLQQSWDDSRVAYRSGCDLGNMQSCYGLARFLIDGHMGDIDREGGRALLKFACENDLTMCEEYVRALIP